ncbi:MAG: hypothetical protein PHQ86_00645 [Dehalococcoidales bacterium]|nr:hypothetical protein [Dehalococcoidales bacterium]
MVITKHLYQLQELDSEIESNEQMLAKISSQLGESQTVIKAKEKLELEQQRLAEFKQQQHSAEWEIEDIENKLTPVEEKLYSGRIKDPKELNNLQHEVDTLKTRRNKLDDKALEIMEQVEKATVSEAALIDKFKTLEAEWQSQQQQLTINIDQLNIALTNLNQKRQLLISEIDSPVIELYENLRKQKGQAVVKVEKGICRGCRILLPITNLQRARGNNLVQCSSCGRILFLP